MRRRDGLAALAPRAIGFCALSRRRHDGSVDPPGQSSCLTDEELAELLYGLLPAKRRLAAERHLDECSACRALATGFRSVLTTMRLGHSSEGALAPGQRVGRYEIVETVGEGAMGTVYAAHDPSLDRRVALKLIRVDLVGPDLEERLQREAKIMARLSHPEVITVFDAGKHEDRLFIAMEFVDGGTLRQWLAAEHHTWREILSVYRRAGLGLAHAHNAGIVHRDFKPDNVLVGKDGRVRVTDFGVARTERQEPPGAGVSPMIISPLASTRAALLTRTGALIGTPQYMAPEQLEGQSATVRSDLYSFCVALYEGLYGHGPFEGRTLREHQDAKLAGRVRPPPPGSRVSRQLRRVLLVGLSLHPENRHSSMWLLLEALERATHRRKVPFVAAAAGLAVAAAAGAAAWLHTQHLRSDRTDAPSTASGGPGSAVPTKRPCASSRACVAMHDGAPFVCRPSDGTCVAVASEDCKPRFEPGDLDADDLVWLGALFPATGEAAKAYGEMNLEGANFARRELAEATRALGGAGASLHVRRIGLVACDDAQDALRAARHLVDDVGVPAVLGFAHGQEVVDVAGGLLVGRGVLSVATVTASPLITRLPQPPGSLPMVWRTFFSLDDMAGALGPIVRSASPGLSARRRWALVRMESASALSFAEAIHKRLISGANATGPGVDDYREVTFRSGEAARDKAPEVIRTVVEAEPSTVILLASESEIAPLVAGIEAQWGGGARPTYWVANGGLDAFADYLGKSVDRRRRLFSILSDSSSPENARFVLRYNAAHPAHVTMTLNPGASYDAFYALAYGIYALGAEEVTGSALGRALSRLLPPGEPIEVGPTQVFDGLRALAAGRSIDLQGATSGLDFDTSTGEPPFDFEVICPAVDREGRATGGELESGLVYRAKTGRVEGRLRCP
jgi:ABC-type branched-subunit amino acid transport system substrate-binding protein/predicted Ser/Thr protein kinase